MNWMNASAAAAADRRNAELSRWDHSVESPDGMGRRDADDRHLAAEYAAEEARKEEARRHRRAMAEELAEQRRQETEEFARLPEASGRAIVEVLAEMTADAELVACIGQEAWTPAARLRPDGRVAYYRIYGERVELAFIRGGG